MSLRSATLNLCRVLHTYLTILGLVVLLFFGLSGFIAHHADWFGTDPEPRILTGTTPADIITKGDRLTLVEHLRKTFRITGAVTNYVQDEKITIDFAEPGRKWEATIDKTGPTEVKATVGGLAGILTDLHKAQNAGPAWPWVIDICAGLLILACITGTILWLSMPRRRKLGVLALLLGTVLALGIYWKLIPGPDKNLTPEAANSVAGNSSPATPNQPQP